MNTNKSEQKNESKNGILRMAIVCLSVILQALFIISLFTWLSGIARWIEAGTSIIALFFVLMIYSKDSISAIKTPWILLIMVFPVVGMVLYLLVIFNPSVKKMKRKYERIDGERTRLNYRIGGVPDVAAALGRTVLPSTNGCPPPRTESCAMTMVRNVLVTTSPVPAPSCIRRKRKVLPLLAS